MSALFPNLAQRLSRPDLFGRIARRVRRNALELYRKIHGEMTRNIKRLSRQTAQMFGVVPDIHQRDFMFWAIHEGNGRQGELTSVRDYFQSGRDTALELKRLLEPHLEPGPFDLLDFAAGYIRVSRHFPNVWPEARLTVSDIHPAAVEFARKLGFRAEPSTWTPEQYCPGEYDVIVTVSFFTHMPRDTWQRWLLALAKCLKPGGLLLFTTHGQSALSSMGVESVGSDGFLFFEHSEQKDLDLGRYGATATLPSFVQSALAEVGLDIVEAHTPGLGWQDAYIVRRAAP